MTKPTKLTEKAARIPDTRQAQWDEAIAQYLREIEPLHNESARSHRFAMLAQELLSIEPGFIESYSAGIEKLLKPMQSRGLWGPRDIHKKVLELPIPQFEAEHDVHLRLAELGQVCRVKVQEWLAGGGTGSITSIGKLRGIVRQMLAEELGEIDGLVGGIMT